MSTSGASATKGAPAKGGLPQGTSLVKVTAQSMHPSSFPLMEMPAIAFVLAISAGSLNAWTFAKANTFATVQSGNIIQLGYQLVAGDWSKFGFVAGAVLAFGLGSFVAGAIITTTVRSGKRYTPRLEIFLILIMGLSLVLIATDAMRAEHITWLISFAAGVQGNGFHKIKGLLYGNVAVTLVIQLAFNYLMQAFFTKKAGNGMSNLYTSGMYFLVLLGFAGGGGIGFLADQAWAGLSIVVSILISFALLITSLKDKADPDPAL